MSLHQICNHKLKSRFQREFWLVSFAYVAKTLLLIAKCLHLLMLHPIKNLSDRKEFNVTNVRSATYFSWHAVVEGFWSVIDKLSLCRGANFNMVTPLK